MQTRSVRFLLAAMLLATGCGAGYWTWTLVQHVAGVERTGRQLSVRIDQFEARLDEVDDRELIYAATGRFDPAVFESVSSLLQEIASDVPSLLAEAEARDTPPAAALAESAAAIADIDAKARENARAGIDLMAADLIFTETRHSRRIMRQQLRELRAADARKVAAVRSADLTQASLALALAVLLLAWGLVRWSPPSTQERPSVGVARAGSTVAAASPPREAVDGRPRPTVDLEAAADLCTDVGRLKLAADLNGLLGRASAVLGASGVVVWMAAGDQMFPAAAHGYDPSVLSRLGPIGRASLNATAEAWRTGLLQTVGGDSASKGAVVAPMMGSERCIGALAFELAAGREADTSIQAVARLFAAQLAAVLAAWPAGSASPSADMLRFEKAAGAST